MLQSIDKKKKILIYLIFLLILSTLNNKNIKNKKSYSNNINKIDIIGLSDNDNLKLLNKLSIFFYKNIFFIDKEEVNKIITKNNIVEYYNVKKIYPSKLSINIKPTKIIARIVNNDQLLVGANGKIIKNETTNQSLPLINGKFSPEEFLKLKKNIDNSRFNLKELELLTLHPSKRWDILTTKGIIIRLPEYNLLESLNLAHRVINNKKFIEKKIIDLRVNNHLIVK